MEQHLQVSQWSVTDCMPNEYKKRWECKETQTHRSQTSHFLKVIISIKNSTTELSCFKLIFMHYLYYFIVTGMIDTRNWNDREKPNKIFSELPVISININYFHSTITVCTLYM